MRPVRLELTNIRSFRGKHEIDFSDLSLFAILGDTGAGKSSILEAITYALFNRSTWSGRDVKELIAKGASAMSVALTFSVGEHEYRIERVTKAKASSIHCLRCETRRIDVEGDAGVRSAIEEILHLDAEAFLHTILLPQGRFADLLTEDDAPRNKILSDLFRLDQIPSVQALARSEESAAAAHLSALEVHRREFPADPVAAVELARCHAGEATTTVERLGEAAAAARRLTTIIGSVDEQLRRIDQRSASIADAETLLAQFDELTTAAAQIDDEARAVDARLASAQRDLACAQRELRALTTAHRDADALRAFDRTLEAIASERQELARLERERAAIDQRLADATERVAALTEPIQTATDRAARASDDARVAEERAAEMRSQVASLGSAVDALKRASETRSNHAASIDLLERKLDDLQQQEVALAEDVRRATAEAESARLDLEAAVVRNQAVAIGTHLHPGDQCPICDRALPDDYVAPADPHLDEVREIERQARERRRAIEKDHACVRAECAAIVRRLAEDEANLKRLADEEERARAALSARLPSSIGDPDQALAGLAAELRKTEEEIPRLRRASVDASAALAELEKRLAVATEQKRSRDGELRKVECEMSTRALKTDHLLASLPDEFRSHVSPTDVSRARAGVERALREALRVVERLQDANGTIARVSVVRSDLHRRKSDEIIGPRSRLLHRFDSIAHALAMSEAQPSDDRMCRSWVTRVHDAARARLEDDERDKAELAARRASHAQQLAEILSAAGASAPEELEERRAEARVALGAAQQELERRRGDASKAAELDAKIERLTPVKMGLGLLRDALGARGFVDYATKRRQHRLLEVGTAILDAMTSGRYAFTDNFEIFDVASNAARSPSTLSGGEKFLASMALSLAVVEIAAASGAKIDSLFLDEGFGALDAETLETAMLELRKRAKAGRAIGVITHLSQVTDFVNETFIVTKSADGSRVERMLEPLTEDEALAEGLVSQLAGTV